MGVGNGRLIDTKENSDQTKTYTWEVLNPINNYGINVNIDNDEKWRTILLGLNKEFYHQTVNTQQIESYLNTHIKVDLKSYFEQYLRTIKIPVLEYRIENNGLSYRWSNIVDGFSIPVKVSINSNEQWITSTKSWKKLQFDKKIASFSVDKNFYIDVKNKSN